MSVLHSVPSGNTGLFIVVMFFWVIFDQHSTTWIYFANDYLNIQFTTPFPINGRTEWRIPPESVQSTNPIMIILFVPLLNWLFGALAKRGFRIRPTDKMIVGFFLTAMSCFIHYIAGTVATQTDGSIVKVTVVWQIVAYVMLTLAEVLISVTGLELAFTAAPKSMKSFVTALWFVPIFLANVLTSQLAKTYPNSVKPGEIVKEPVFELFGKQFFTLPQFSTAQQYFLAMTVALVVAGLIFIFVARRFNQLQAKVTPQ